MEKEFTLECPHCCNRTQLVIKGSVTQTETISMDEDHHPFTIDYYYYTVQCKTCGEVSLYADCEADDNPGNINQALRLYPAVKKLEAVPKAIRDIYEEAKRIEKRSPTAFAILLRKALEYLCIDQSAVGGNLKSQLDDLAAKGIIPATLARMANALRYFGNLGAHSGDIKIGTEEAGIMDNFFLTVIEYVYIAPGKLDKLTQRVNRPKNT